VCGLDEWSGGRAAAFFLWPPPDHVKMPWQCQRHAESA
jgi:hypothetical protein